MKNILFLFLATSLFVACQNSSKADKVATTPTKEAKAPVAAKVADRTLKVSPDGIVGWVGKKLAGEHKGTLAISNGTLNIANGTVAGGDFTIDMNSLTCLDMEAGEGKEKLEGHLKSADFFDVANNPTSSFTITSVAGNQITGDLTMLGVTKPVTFNANMNIMEEGAVIRTDQFTINRTDWGLKYGSASFFDVVKDKAINDEITLQIRFKAT